MLKRMGIKVGIGIAAIFLFIAILVALLGGAISEDDDVNCYDDAITGSFSTKGTAGAWTQKGTKAYNNAKSVFMSWVHEGLSGAAAAGIVGWINSEGGFQILDRAESHLGSSEKENGIAYGVVPIPSSSTYSVGGAGIYQFTPYTKFAPIGSKKWLSAAAQTAFVKKELQMPGGWNPAMDLTGGNHSFAQFAKATDPKQAAKMWNAYERGKADAVARALPTKLADAMTAYRLFGGSKFKAKPGLLGSAAKSASNASNTSSGDEDCGDDGENIGSNQKLVAAAKKLIGYFRYGAHMGFGDWKNPNRNGQTDCSGFVWLAMKRAGYPVGDVAFATPVMEADAKGAHKWFKQIKPEQARPGDVIIMNRGVGYNGDGHTAIIVGKYKNYQTKIIEMGGDHHNGVHVSNIHDSFLSLINSNARVTWARPVGGDTAKDKDKK